MSQATQKAVVHKIPSFNFQVMPKMVFLTHVTITVAILHSHIQNHFFQRDTVQILFLYQW
jgi:hypothetical protein